MSLVVGLTGSIATGKSMVADLIKKHNIPVIDADIISREVVEQGEPAYQKIIEVFGEDIIGPDGEIDRKKLGSVVFKDESKRRQLNAIVHPAVREKMIASRDQLVNTGEKLIVMDIPLLFESKLTHFVDKTLVIYTSKETQLQRLMKRDNSSREDALSRISAQLSIEEKASMADEVIYNDNSKEETEKQLEQLLQSWGIYS